MRRRVGVMFWLEAVLASFSAFIVVLTLVWHDWIEGILWLRSGSAQRLLRMGAGRRLPGSDCALGALARREWRRAVVA